MKKYLAILLILLQISCGGKYTPKTNTSTPNKTDVENSIFDIKDKSYLFSEPKPTSKKLINEKATQVLKETTYLSIDRSCRVQILETSGEWSRIQVIEPNWLYHSHIGWVKTDVIEMGNKNSEYEQFYKNKDYKTLQTDYKGKTANRRVLVLWEDFDETKLDKLAKHLKEKEFSNEKCNIAIYDSESILNLIGKYPLTKSEYVKLADHYVYQLTADGYSSFYPLVDIQYKEYGGTRPIE